MALFPPTDTATRPLTSNKQRTGNIEGPKRYPELGGFSSSQKVGGKSPFNQKPPGTTKGGG